MASSFIGKPISLISHSDIRYRGTLAGIDPHASTIQLENVYSMGTELRRPANQFIAPVSEPYAYIVFRASEVKDLSVDEQTPAPPARSVHDDPAVLGASAPIAKPAYLPPQSQEGYTPQQAQPSSAAATPPPAPPSQNEEVDSQGPRTKQQQGGNANRTLLDPVHSANASLVTVERAMSDLRINGGAPTGQGGHGGHGGGRGGGRGRGGRIGGGTMGGTAEHVKVPTTDFDFESANAKFDKTATAKAVKTPTGEDITKSGEEGTEKPTEEAPKSAYNPKTSFFDSLSSSASAADRGNGTGGRGRRGGGGGGGGGGGARTRRDEEREKNVATFGEPGGVGLLGPGAYVGGWGGYGRRGSRPRRGGGTRGINSQATR